MQESGTSQRVQLVLRGGNVEGAQRGGGREYEGISKGKNVCLNRFQCCHKLGSERDKPF